MHQIIHITRLQRYSYWFSEDMRSILTIHRETNIHLGHLLQKAHFNARYNANYLVSNEQLSAFLVEVKKLFDLTIKLVKGSPG
jgi:hypothetical protein